MIKSKRKLLTSTLGIGAAYCALPNTWIKPIVSAVVLPAHAQTSSVTGGGIVVPPEPECCLGSAVSAIPLVDPTAVNATFLAAEAVNAIIANANCDAVNAISAVDPALATAASLAQPVNEIIAGATCAAVNTITPVDPATVDDFTLTSTVNTIIAAAS